MELKLNHTVSQTGDRRAAFETGVENELRARIKLMGSHGVMSADAADVDNDLAACALSISGQDANAIDVGGGTVVFPNGEYVDIGSSDIAAIPIDTAVTDAQVIRLEYLEVDDGEAVSNPYYGFATKPKKRKGTALEMLIVESATTYGGRNADTLAKSVVLGVARYDSDGTLVVDNGRDTYTYSRPWFTPTDAEHRSQVGTGTATTTNPHATSLNDLTVGNYTAWQALVGQPACVLARPNGYGKLPGEICTETVPAGNFVTDTTGLVTGVAGALYANIGAWPERLLRAALTSDSTTQVAAWVPRGRNVIAVLDPENFPAAVSVTIYYTKVTAGAMPGSLGGLTAIEVGQPTGEELVVAGGNFFTELTENKVLFTDVGLIPMRFDIMVDNTGRAYKSPDVIYCNTALDTLGASPQSFTIQPRAAGRLRFAISNYNIGYTEVKFLVTGTDESGATISETVTFTGPAAVSPQTSYTEVAEQRIFTAAVFANPGQVQVTTRNGDGPNTTVTVFMEAGPERPAVQDDLLLATVQWTGSEISGLYSSDADVAIDRRLVTRGGGNAGLSAIGAAANSAMLVDSVLGYLPAGSTQWATFAEDFNDPSYVEYPNDYVGVQTGQHQLELTANSLGARNGYISRLLSLGSTFSDSDVDSLWLRMLPRSMRGFPARLSNNFKIQVDLYKVGGTVDTFAGTLGTNPYPPYQVNLTGPALSGDYYAAQISMTGTGVTVSDLSEVFQGFVFHMRG